jgi:hypothetical protein
MDTASGTSWLVRPISPTKAEFGVIAVDLGTKKSSEIEAMKRQIESVLAYVEKRSFGRRPTGFGKH